jgi:hypothetical protein
MSNERVKTYRNHKRQISEKYTPYVPQYQVWGVEPNEYKSAVVSKNQQVKTTTPKEAIQRVRKVGVRQPYAESVPSPLGRGNGPIPNVGNNVEHTWSSVDGEIVDDLSGPIDPNHPMVDNNDVVSNDALGVSKKLSMLNEPQNPQQLTPHMPSVEEDLFPVVRDLEEGAYLLIVSGVPICSGPKEEIEEQARALIFGEHELSDGNPIPDDDIVIIKRVPIKIGLFLE